METESQFMRVCALLRAEGARKSKSQQTSKLQFDKPSLPVLKAYFGSHGESIHAAIESWKGEGPFQDIGGEAEAFFVARLQASVFFLQLFDTVESSRTGKNPLANECSDAELIRWLLTDWFDSNGALLLYTHQIALSLIDWPK